MIDDRVLLNIPTRGLRGPGSVAASVATTALASEAGTYVGKSKSCFLRSVTFSKSRALAYDWDIKLIDTPPSRKGRKHQIYVDDTSGLASCLRVKAGDYLYSINGKRIGASFNAQRAMELMNTCLEKEEILNISIRNDSGSDILLEATVYKDDPGLTLKDLGIIAWKWGTLCVKSIDKESHFCNSVLKSNDHIVSVNDIVCDGITPEDFTHIVNNLPDEVSIVVRRNKQRWTGKFG